MNLKILFIAPDKEEHLEIPIKLNEMPTSSFFRSNYNIEARLPLIKIALKLHCFYSL